MFDLTSFYRTQQMFGIGRKKTASVWVVVRDYVSKTDARLLVVKQGDMLWLYDQLENPQLNPTTNVLIGYYPAKHMKHENNKEENDEEHNKGGGKEKEQQPEEEQVVDPLDHTQWQRVPSNVVRRASSHEEASCREGMLPTWSKMYDARSVKYYYFNNFTNESVWEKPDDFVEPTVAQLEMGLSTNPRVTAAMVRGIGLYDTCWWCSLCPLPVPTTR
jgi:hypothetical protein